MNKKSMTALVSAFSRIYHYRNNEVRVFSDSIGGSILSDEEYEEISSNMKKGIGFFNPEFVGSDDEALRWIVDNILSPSPLGRANFAEEMLENSVRIGASQYLIMAAGYDSFAYRQPKFVEDIEIFEIDHPITQDDKKRRTKNILKEKNINNLSYISADFRDDDWQEALMNNIKFNEAKISFCTLLGISYYLTKEDLRKLINKINELVPEGSSIIFDYLDQDNFTDKAGDRAKKQAMLASASGEEMLGSYSYAEVEKILSDSGFLVYEHLEPKDITKRFFEEYNENNPSNRITAFDNVNYLLAVKK